MNLVEDETSRVVENHNQEISHLLDRLAEMGIGRPLYVVQTESPLSETEQAQVGMEFKPEVTLTKVGHTLPADEQGRFHIVIDLDGGMMYIGAMTVSSANILWYQDLFSEGGTRPLPPYLLPTPGITILDTLRVTLGSLPIEPTAIIDGRQPEKYPQVKAKFDLALQIAQKRKEAIEETKLQMKKDVTAGLRGLLNPPPPPPAAPPPAAQ